ncbi:hypothetical protein D6219_05195 [Coxiella burnetii]|uniref:Dot/Icm T4SS effector CoxCC7 n=1 Tax=Coxiella burnetii TaxID=777 RepID=UPI0002D69575|nr:Dot/Icm T4SS effector CoxCC7 [Coxiella burnetii]AZV75259.1 hypothetical protein D6219_05195 [Coxiella burnetii]
MSSFGDALRYQVKEMEEILLKKKFAPGETASLFQHRGKLTDTLLFVTGGAPNSQEIQRRAKITKLLTTHGAALQNDKNKEIFLSNTIFMVVYGKSHEAYSFRIYMPLLEVFASNALLDEETIQKLAKLSPDNEEVENKLKKLLQSIKIKSEVEIRKNVQTLKIFGIFPEELNTRIAALTASLTAHDEKQAEAIALASYNGEYCPESIKNQMEREQKRGERTTVQFSTSDPMTYSFLEENDGDENDNHNNSHGCFPPCCKQM